LQKIFGEEKQLMFLNKMDRAKIPVEIDSGQQSCPLSSIVSEFEQESLARGN
jgi:hypothetical protein